MTTSQSKELLSRAVDELPPEKVSELVEFARRLCLGKDIPKRANPRILGAYEGKIRILPEFYEPLPDELLDAFEGKCD